MNYCNIKTRDIADGVGVRVTLFVSGCRNHCKNCFQPETWDFNYGEPFTKEVEDHLIEELRPDFVDGLTLLGGEPGEAENQRGLLPFLQRVRKELPNKTIWCYSGFTWEQLTGKEPARCRCEVTDEFLSLLDVLVDGPYVEELHDITLLFRGSANQRLIDVPATLKAGEVTLWRP
ncbi:MAG: anaerobic ribonucleoside-triphosphate reductase activating protein [Oscillospiraceae bacterium]|nr:anaerobic ribonucleoside-triphosphate reductase activating protein [Oscillospiraceae bacterium]